MASPSVTNAILATFVFVTQNSHSAPTTS